MNLLYRINIWVSHKYYDLFWRDIPKWKGQTHRLKIHKGNVPQFISWVHSMLEKGEQAVKK